MNPIDLLLEPLAYDFFVRALVASALVGVACAVVGSFVVLKGMSFIGDAVSHAAFPGIVIAYMFGLPIILGGAVAAAGLRLPQGAAATPGAAPQATAQVGEPDGPAPAPASSAMPI